MTRLSALLALAAAPALAQTGRPAADALLAEVLEHQRAVLSCSVLDPEVHPFALSHWAEVSAWIVELLAGAGVGPEAIGSFAAAAQPGALMLPETMPFPEIRAFCAGHPDWSKDFATYRIFAFPRELERALAE